MKELIRPVVIEDKLVWVGEQNDGGYIVPEGIMKQCDVCYSYGISDNTEFDRAYHRITGKGAHLYDFSVEAPPNLPSALKFHKEGISGVKTGNCDNYLQHLKANHDENRKVLLKIDVEGAEYEWLLATDIAEMARTALCIVIEFHWLQDNQPAFRQCLEKLKARYHIVHVHGNNCNYMMTDYPMVPDVPEITFVLKSAATFGGPVKVRYPLAGLDHPNISYRPQLMVDYRIWPLRQGSRVLRRIKRTFKEITGSK